MSRKRIHEPYGNSLDPVMHVTHRSFVNHWECDENDHWNVQFYSRAFQHAAEAFAVMNGLENPGETAMSVRHIRYHRELRAATAVIVTTARIVGGAHEHSIVHAMREIESGVLSATAIDRPDYATDGLPGIDHSELAAAMPRGLVAEVRPAENSDKLLADGTATVTNIRTVRPHELDHAGKLIANEVVSRITDGAPHAWHHLGVRTEWLREHSLGRVAVEMKLARHADCQAGDVIRVVSWMSEIERRTFVLRHQLENVSTGEVLASGEVRCLLMDLNLRKAAQLPELLTRQHGRRRMKSHSS